MVQFLDDKRTNSDKKNEKKESHLFSKKHEHDGMSRFDSSRNLQWSAEGATIKKKRIFGRNTKASCFMAETLMLKTRPHPCGTLWERKFPYLFSALKKNQLQIVKNLVFFQPLIWPKNLNEKIRCHFYSQTRPTEPSYTLRNHWLRIWSRYWDIEAHWGALKSQMGKNCHNVFLSFFARKTQTKKIDISLRLKWGLKIFEHYKKPWALYSFSFLKYNGWEIENTPKMRFSNTSLQKNHEDYFFGNFSPANSTL